MCLVKINFTLITVIIILLVTNLSYGQDSLDRKNSGEMTQTVLQIKDKITALENIRQKIIEWNLSETEKTQIKEELHHYIEQAFNLINEPSNKKLLAYSQNIISTLLPKESVSKVNDLITIASLNLTTEKKIELFYLQNESSCYDVYVTGFFILIIAVLFAIVGTSMFGTPPSLQLILLSFYMTAIGLSLAAIGLACMLLAL